MSEIFYPLLNLVLLIGVLVYFARRPVRQFFADRKLAVQDQLESAAALQREAEARYAEWQGKLADLDAELEVVRSEARDRAAAERERILAEANAAAERVRNDARVAVDRELRRSREALRQEASDLAVQLATALLRERIEGRDRERLVEEFIAEVGRGDDGRGAGS